MHLKWGYYRNIAGMELIAFAVNGCVDGAIHISGRSDNSISVQKILERMGGGGRFDSAGASLKDTKMDVAIATLKGAISAHFADLEARRNEKDK